MDSVDFNLPEFVLGDFPIKDGSFNDTRQFIFHRGISLIEIIHHDTVHILFEDKVFKEYSFFNESFTLCYHTNNSNYIGTESADLLDRAWEWYREYLIWQDTGNS